jgi:hypothetical protein
VFSGICSAQIEIDTFPSLYWGTWSYIGGCDPYAVCQWVPLDQRPSQQKIIITRDSLICVENDSTILRTDSCYIDTLLKSTLYVFSNLEYIYLLGDTLVEKTNTEIWPNDSRYLRTGSGTLSNNENRPTKTIQCQYGKSVIVNLLGQKEIKSNAMNILIDSHLNKTSINMKQ